MEALERRFASNRSQAKLALWASGPDHSGQDGG